MDAQYPSSLTAAVPSPSTQAAYEKLAKEHDKATIETASHIAQITEEVQKKSHAARAKMFEARNEANRQWKHLDDQGSTQRHLDTLESAFAVEDTLELSQQNIAAQQAELDRYTREMEEMQAAVKQEAELAAEEAEKNFAANLQQIQNTKKLEVEIFHAITEHERATASKEMETHRHEQISRRKQEKEKNDEEIRAIEERTRIEIERIRIRRQAEANRNSRKSWNPLRNLELPWGRSSVPDNQTHSRPQTSRSQSINPINKRDNFSMSPPQNPRLD